MKRFTIAAALLALGTVGGHADQPTPDKGTLVFSSGGVGGNDFTFDLCYRSTGPEPDNKACFNYSLFGDLFSHGTDFEGHEKGVVRIDHLPPGNYEFYIFHIKARNARFWPKSEFSIPFAVHAGQTTYVGDFALKLITKRNFIGIHVPAGGYFVVSDKHDRDIPIALKREPALQPVTVSVPDVSTLGLPYLLSEEGPSLLQAGGYLQTGSGGDDTAH